MNFTIYLRFFSLLLITENLSANKILGGLDLF